MLMNLTSLNLAFKSSDLTSPRASYSAKVKQNSQIAQKETEPILNPGTKNIQTSNQISMQGTNQGQKLNVIA